MGVDLGTAVGFFFSSRRRHTRFDCDWSSDVCSSDLTSAVTSLAFSPDGKVLASACGGTGVPGSAGENQVRLWDVANGQERSEERRVGKEWRGRGAVQGEAEEIKLAGERRGMIHAGAA